MPNISWDELYMQQAFVVAKGSKDPSTKVGAVIVTKDNEPVSQGYNGFPKGCDESHYSWDRPIKYYLVNHAEMNALSFAKDKRDLKGAKIYITHHPCEACMKQCIAEGITEFIFEDDSVLSRFNEFQKQAIDIMRIANPISVRQYIRKHL